jgi:hypothetical protein
VKPLSLIEMLKDENEVKVQERQFTWSELVSKKELCFLMLERMNKKKEIVDTNQLLNKEKELKLLEKELERKSRCVEFVLDSLQKKEKDLEERERIIEKKEKELAHVELPKNVNTPYVPNIVGIPNETSNRNSSGDIKKQTSFRNAFSYFKKIESTPRETPKIQSKNSGYNASTSTSNLKK